MANGYNVGRHPICFENDTRSAYRELSHAAGAKAAADDQAFSLFPRFQLEKAPNDQRELLREFLDRTLDNSGCLWITVAEQAIKLLLGDFLVDLVSLGVYSGFGDSFSRVLDELTKCSFR